MHEAAPIALQTVMDFLASRGESELELVRFVLYGRPAYQVYQRALTRLSESGAGG
jgi:O-acetyl-ADP-ribose deacetylase (regulator of RNase III)